MSCVYRKNVWFDLYHRSQTSAYSSKTKLEIKVHYTMLADAQHDGRPVECTWRLLMNAVDQMAKITNSKRETR